MLFAIVVINFHETRSFPIFQIKSHDFTITMLLEASEEQLAERKRDCRFEGLAKESLYRDRRKMICRNVEAEISS